MTDDSDSEPDSEPVGPNVQVTLPERVAGGTFADFMSVSQNGRYFTLDFAAITNVAAGPQGVPTISAQVVSRVRILPEQVIEIMKTLGGQLTAYEQATGTGTPTEPPWESPQEDPPS